MLLISLLTALLIAVSIGLETIYKGYQLSQQHQNFTPPYYRLGKKFTTTGIVILLLDLLFGSFYELGLFTKIGNLVLVFGLGVLVLAHTFNWLDRKFHLAWLHYILIIGVILTGITTYTITTYQLDNLNSSLSVFGFFNLLLDELVLLGYCILFGILATLALIVLYHLVFGKNGHLTVKTFSNETQAFQHHLNKDKLQHYKNAGLTDSEIQCFRNQMAEAKQLILQLTSEFEKNAKLRAIETRHNTIKVCQSFFKEIVKEPKQLSKASHFLYKLLPSLTDLLNKYNEINNHVAKNNQTFMILEKTAQTIEQLSLEISDEYINFHESDFADLNDEIKLAQHNLHNHSVDTNDDIFNFNLNENE